MTFTHPSFNFKSLSESAVYFLVIWFLPKNKDIDGTLPSLEPSVWTTQHCFPKKNVNPKSYDEYFESDFDSFHHTPHSYSSQKERGNVSIKCPHVT